MVASFEFITIIFIKYVQRHDLKLIIISLVHFKTLLVCFHSYSETERMKAMHFHVFCLEIEGQKALVVHMQIESFAMLVLRSSPYFIDTCQYIGAHLGRSVEVVHALWATTKQKRQKSSICSAAQNGASNILRTQPTCILTCIVKSDSLHFFLDTLKTIYFYDIIVNIFLNYCQFFRKSI